MPSEAATINFIMIILDQLDLKCIDWDQVASRHGVTNGHAARMRFSRLRKAFNGHVPTRRERKSAGVSKCRKSNDKIAKLAKVEGSIVKKEEEAPATPVSCDESLRLTPVSLPDQSILKIERDENPLPNYDPFQTTHDKFDPGSEYGFPTPLPNFPLYGTYQPLTLPYRSAPQMTVEDSEMEFNKLMSLHEAKEKDDVLIKQEPKWGEEYDRFADNIRSGISHPDVFRVDKLGDVIVEQAVGHLEGQICFCCDCQMTLKEEREEMDTD